MEETWDEGSVPGLKRSPEGGNGHPLQCSCLESPRAEEPGRLQSTGLTESDRTEMTACVPLSFSGGSGGGLILFLP